MTKKEYLAALATELQALPYDEQQEALEYYQNYFDDAGAENEQKVINELGTVEELGTYIRSNFACVPARIINDENDTDDTHSGTQTDDYLVQQVKSLDITIAVAKLEIRHGEGLSVKIENTNKSRIYSTLKNDGTLKIDSKPYIVFKIINFKTPKVTITLPKGMNFESVSIKTEAGSIIGKNLDIITSTSDISANAGTIQLNGITSEKTEIDSNAGSISVSGTFSKHTEVNCNAGKIAVSGTVRGQTKIDCNMGSIDVHTTGNIDEYSHNNESNFATIRINTNNISGLGSQTSGTQKQNHFSINCNMGSVGIRVK